MTENMCCTCRCVDESNKLSVITSPPEGVARYYFHPVCLSVCLSVCACVCLCVCVSVCPANILVFYLSAIRRDIDLECIQDTYMVVLNSPSYVNGQGHRDGTYHKN